MVAVNSQVEQRWQVNWKGACGEAVHVAVGRVDTLGVRRERLRLGQQNTCSWPRTLQPLLTRCLYLLLLFILLIFLFFCLLVQYTVQISPLAAPRPLNAT